jgi:hypothetical protein
MKVAVTILVAATLSGCAIITGEGEINEEVLNPPVVDNVQPHFGDTSPWVGRHMSELIAERGHPDSVYLARHMFAEFDADLPVTSLVYAAYPCVDAFVVDIETKIIIKYHCR